MYVNIYAENLDGVAETLILISPYLFEGKQKDINKKEDEYGD
jgi:hypothetical protein